MNALAVLSPLVAEIPLRQQRASAVGVYFLIADETIVYVGQSCSVLGRIQLHELEADSDSATAKVFTRATWIAIPVGLLNAYEGALIRALRPRYNRRAPAYLGGDNAILLGLGLAAHDDEAANARSWLEHVRHWSGGGSEYAKASREHYQGWHRARREARKRAS